MTATELLKLLPEDWRDASLGVFDNGVCYSPESVELVRLAEDGRVCVILHGKAPYAAGNVAERCVKEKISVVSTNTNKLTPPLKKSK